MILKSKNNRFGALIVAGGCGRRFGKKNKLFAKIAEIPVFVKAILPFKNICENRIVLVVPESLQDEFKKLAKKFIPDIPIKYAYAGKERTDSVANGLAAMSGNNLDFIAIHDAARPLITEKLISEAFTFAVKNNSAVVSARISDTIKKTNDKDEIINTLDRNNLWAAQTPQIFKYHDIIVAYKKVIGSNKKFTDDAAVMEFSGFKVKIFENISVNTKITYPYDIPIAKKKSQIFFF